MTRTFQDGDTDTVAIGIGIEVRFLEDGRTGVENLGFRWRSP
jgi:hypothetical protein